jgi:nucleoside-diphosphate-sugar epimerase
MRHLITGGSGFIGSLVALRLREQGEQVRILDIWKDTLLPEDIEFFNCSVLDRYKVGQAMQGVDVVHHNAALVAQTAAGKRYWQVNVYGSRIVADEAAKAGVQAFIHTSSTSVFGIPPKDGGPITNQTTTLPAEAYGRSKLAGEKLTEEICQKHGIPLITIRPRATLGAGRLGIFQVLFQWIKENRNVYVIGDGNNKFQFIHALDLMDFYMLALNRGRTGTYNVGADEFKTLRQDIESLIQYAGSLSKIKSLPKNLTINTLRILHAIKLSPLVPYHYMTYHTSCYFDVQPLLDMGWKPRYSNQDMLRESYDWFMNVTKKSRHKNSSPHRSPLKQGILWLLKQAS